MPRKLPIPPQPIQISQENVHPYPLADLGKPAQEPELVRGEQISVKGDPVKIIVIGLEDIDNAILYYFENIIKPTVTQNGQTIVVPTIYGSPERWKSIQEDGYYRDKNGKIMYPLIIFKRETIEKNRTLGNKLDGNKVHNYEVFEKRYSQRNNYDAFSVLNNRIPQRELYATMVPDYLTLTYNCIIFTNFVAQNNKLIEAVEFASDSYWGNPERFKFKARIDSFSTTTVLEQEEDRVARTNFTLTLNGYIIPDTINKQLATASPKFYSKSQVIFTFEGISSDGNFTETTQPILPPPTGSSGYIFTDSDGNQFVNSNGDIFIIR